MPEVNFVDDPKWKSTIDEIQQFLNGFDPIKEHIPVIASAIVNNLDSKQVQAILNETCPATGFARPEHYIPEKLVEHLSNVCDKYKAVQDAINNHNKIYQGTNLAIKSEQVEAITMFMLQHHVSTPPIDIVIDAVSISDQRPTLAEIPTVLKNYIHATIPVRHALAKAYDSLPKREGETANRAKDLDLGVAYYMLKHSGSSTSSLSDLAKVIAEGLKHNLRAEGL